MDRGVLPYYVGIVWVVYNAEVPSELRSLDLGGNRVERRGYPISVLSDLAGLPMKCVIWGMVGEQGCENNG